jgi:hypothetical protein
MSKTIWKWKVPGGPKPDPLPPQPPREYRTAFPGLGPIVSSWSAIVTTAVSTTAVYRVTVPDNPPDYQEYLRWKANQEQAEKEKDLPMEKPQRLITVE